MLKLKLMSTGVQLLPETIVDLLNQDSDRLIDILSTVDSARALGLHVERVFKSSEDPKIITLFEDIVIKYDNQKRSPEIVRALMVEFVNLARGIIFDQKHNLLDTFFNALTENGAIKKIITEASTENESLADMCFNVAFLKEEKRSCELMLLTLYKHGANKTKEHPSGYSPLELVNAFFPLMTELKSELEK